MTHKHTPGPWFSEYSESNKSLDIYGFSGECVATVRQGAGNNKSNARLIAAAPDLLEALELALANLKPKYSEDHIVVKKLTEAIAKANGE